MLNLQSIDWTIVVIILQLIFLEGILSIDNAAVLGALVTPLPHDQPVPWPHALRRFGAWLNPLVGEQREAALRVGLLGAYLGRGLMLLMASFIVSNPWLKLVGAIYLIRLAFDSLSESSESGSAADHETHPIKERAFWSTVLTVELMDLAFSLDNVVAAVSLSDKLWVVAIGVAIGILTMRFAASLFSYAVEREPILKQAAYLLVLNIGIELILEEMRIIEINDALKFLISVSTIGLALLYAHFKPLQKLRFMLIYFSQGFRILNDLMDWLLLPFKALAGLVFRLGRSLFTPRPVT
jgi:tellurite resistance protein TerC